MHHIILLTLVILLMLKEAFVETVLLTLRKVEPWQRQNDVLGVDKMGTRVRLGTQKSLR